MNSHLVTYLQDHLAGSRFAISLLGDLASQQVCNDTAKLARELLVEIEADRDELERIVADLGAEASSLKEVSAWIAQKTGRLKFSVGDEFGVFEAIEFLSLGVLGKRALWRLLQNLMTTGASNITTNFESLIGRADDQFQQLEKLRLQLGVELMRAK